MLLPVFALKMGDASWLPYQDVQPKRLGCGSGLPHIVPFFVQKKQPFIKRTAHIADKLKTAKLSPSCSSRCWSNNFGQQDSLPFI